MKKILFCALASIVLLVGCDKIEEGNYTIFAGASGTWVEGSGVADHSQRVLLEKYTGQRCVNCPTADNVISNALNTFGSKLIAVAVHDSSVFCRPLSAGIDLRTADGHTWSSTLGMLSAAKPMALLNRQKNGEAYTQFVPTGSLDNDILALLDAHNGVAVDVACAMEDSVMTIDVNVELLKQVAEPMTLTLFIMEDGIVAPQELPDGSEQEDYVHNHLLRDVITDVWGADIETTGESGAKRFCRFLYSDLNPNWNLEKCHIVAFVSHKTSRTILNVAECNISM